MSNKMSAKELKKINIERHVQSLYSGDECKAAVLTAYRYLEKNGLHGMMSESSIETICNIALAFAAGELDWVKDLGRKKND